MKQTLLFFLLSFSLLAVGQNDNYYSIRVFDKNLEQQINSFRINQTDSSLTITYGTRDILLNIPKRKLTYKYLDIFIDTLMNSDDCWILWMQDLPNAVAIHQSKKFSNCYDTHHHVVRNLNYFDPTPQNKYHPSDFIEQNEDYFLGASSGLSYSGLAIGGTFKYYKGLTGYENLIFNSEASIILTGKNKDGIDISAGVRAGPLIPIGLSISSLILDNNYAINIRPEVGWDFGLWSVIYGYNIKLKDDLNLNSLSRHYLKISFALNISRPIKNIKAKYPFDDEK